MSSSLDGLLSDSWRASFPEEEDKYDEVGLSTKRVAITRKVSRVFALSTSPSVALDPCSLTAFNVDVPDVVIQ